jgi:hypothetical protein
MAGLAVVAVLEAANHSLEKDGLRQLVRLPESWSRNLTVEDILPGLADARAMVGAGEAAVLAV